MKKKSGGIFYEVMKKNLNSRSLLNPEEFGGIKAELFGESLEILYKISTCKPVCYGGNHVIEAIAGRCFNHAIASFRLISDCLFDESLNLTRSIAEITNLMFLLNESEPLMKSWINSDKKKRMKEFSPVAVRKALEDLNIPCPVSQSAYSELCELATHVTPETRPNRHDSTDEVAGYVGGNVADLVGRKVAIDKLVLYVSLSAMVISNIFGIRNNVELLAALGENAFNT
jgi:hypothetical protein